MRSLLFLILAFSMACADNNNGADKYSDFAGFNAGENSPASGQPTGIVQPSSGDRAQDSSIVSDASTASADSDGVEVGAENGDADESIHDGGIALSDAGETSDGQFQGADSALPSGDVELGMACESDGDCVEGLTCEVWPTPRGVCTKLECQETGCGEKAQCVQIDASRWGCMPECSSSSECRDGDACKTIWYEGALVSVCHGIDNKAGGEASVCKVSGDCKGKMACMEDYGGGYCAFLGCELTKPCPVATACVAFPAYNACLKMCDEAKLCPGQLLDKQACLPTALVNGEEDELCIAVTVAKEAGAYCESDEECLSGDCEPAGIGLCSDSGESCLGDDSCYGGTCVFTGGICIQTCDYNLDCPEGTVCVPSTPGQGECLKECKSLSDVITCKDIGSCEYGFPLNQGEGGEGQYACRENALGGFGAVCGGDSECESGMCAKGDGEVTGICIKGCGGLMLSGLYVCPWGGACISSAGEFQCLPLCPKGNVQCNAGFDCQSQFLGLPFEMDVCMPQ